MTLSYDDFDKIPFDALSEFSQKHAHARAYIGAKVGYQPTPAQVHMHRAVTLGARFIAINAGRRGGKTMGASIEAVTEFSFPPEGALPIRLIMIVAPTAKTSSKVFEYTVDWIVKKKIFGDTDAPGWRVNISSKFIESPWGSRIECQTAENPVSLLGCGAVLIICDEYARFKEGIYEEYIRPPLMDTGGRAILISTPLDRKNHWYVKCMSWKKLAETDRNFYYATFTSKDNTMLPPGSYELARAEYEAMDKLDVFDRDFNASFTALTGAVYRKFSPIKDGKYWHVNPKMLTIPNIRFGMSIDIGYDHPTCITIFQCTPDDQIRFYEIVYQTGLDELEICSLMFMTALKWRAVLIDGGDVGYEDLLQINKFDRPYAIIDYIEHGRVQFNIKRVYYDTAAATFSDMMRSRFRFPMYRPLSVTLSNVGQSTVKKKIHGSMELKQFNLKNVPEGIAKMRSFFARKDKPGIVFLIGKDPYGNLLRGNARCIDEIEQYSYNDKGEPEEVNDDGPDAVRYAVYGEYGTKSSGPNANKSYTSSGYKNREGGGTWEKVITAVS